MKTVAPFLPSARRSSPSMASAVLVARMMPRERPWLRPASAPATSSRSVDSCSASQSRRSPAARRRREGRKPETGSRAAGVSQDSQSISGRAGSAFAAVPEPESAAPGPAFPAARSSFSAAAFCSSCSVGAAITTCAFVPPKPKPETPATGRPEYSGHSRGSSTTSRR